MDFQRGLVERIVMHGGDGIDELSVDFGVRRSALGLFVGPGEGIPAALFGYGGNDVLQGGGGDDTLDGGLGADLIDGRNGFDTADYSWRKGDVSVSVGTGADDGEAGEGDHVSSRTECVIGGSGNDSLSLPALAWEDITASGDRWIVPSVNEASPELAGSLMLGDPVLVRKYDQSRLPQLVGGDGNDVLIGHDMWASRLVGGNGNDQLIAAVTSDGKEYRHLQSRLSGGHGDDTLIGGIGNDWLRGGPGSDLLRGGGGLDYADYREHSAGVSVDLKKGTGGIGGSEDTLEGIAHVIGSAFADLIRGTDASNRLAGSGGDDTLIGGGGSDVLFGGAGSDLLAAGDGNDGLYGDLDRLPDATGVDYDAQAENGAVTSVPGFRQRVYEEMDQSKLRLGDWGDDSLFGGAGLDTLHGGEGQDALDGGVDGGIAAYAGHFNAVAVDLAAGIGGDLETPASGDPKGTLDSQRALLEQWWLNGPEWDEPELSDVRELVLDSERDQLVNITGVIGSPQADLIIGDDAPNTLRGGGGADILLGRAGTDILFGGDSYGGSTPALTNWLFGGDDNDFFENPGGTMDGTGDRVHGGRGLDRAFHPNATNLIDVGYYDHWSNRLDSVFDNSSQWTYPGSGSSGSIALDFGSGRRPPY